MKTNIFTFIFSILLAVSAQAMVLEAKPVRDLLSTVAVAEYSFREVGMVFGFNSIKSCLYTSANMVVLKNYCVPKKNYPAKGYTIISPKFGIINFYQEQLSPEILKRDVEITVFPELLRPLINFDLEAATLVQVNDLLETAYKQYGPACWTTNYSRYTDGPDSQCTTKEVLDFPTWSLETQKMTGAEKDWAATIEQLEDKFKD